MTQPKRTLKGCRPEELITAYLEHIQKGDNDTNEDIAYTVRTHGRSKGVRVVSAYTVRNRFCQDVVGCNIVVPVAQALKVDSGQRRSRVASRKGNPRERVALDASANVLNNRVATKWRMTVRKTETGMHAVIPRGVMATPTWPWDGTTTTLASWTETTTLTCFEVLY